MDWPDIILNIVVKAAIIIATPFIWVWKLLVEILKNAKNAFVAIVGTAVAIYVIHYYLLPYLPSLTRWLGH